MRLVGFLFISVSLLAQIPGLTGGAGEKKEEKPVDPFGRTNPRSCLIQFLRAAEAGQYRRAARYLQLPPPQLDTRGVALARDLQAAINAGFTSGLTLISDRPDGTDDDGLPEGQERVGELVIGNESLDLVLVRVDDPVNGRVWLVSQETLKGVPEIAREITGHAIAKRLPEGLRVRFFGLDLYQWLGGLLLFALAYGVAWIVAIGLVRAISRTKYKIGKLPPSLIFLIAIFLHSLSIGVLQIPLLYRSYYRRVVSILILVALTWLLLRGIDWGAELARTRAVARGQLAAGSWIVLTRRLLKFLAVTAVALIVFAAFGFDVSTALAGVGIGGIALGFGAQKTIENLFGGVSVASDQVIRVGDTCNFSGRVGTVTDIGLRSTRMRTLERTELSIPNGVLANMNVENLSMRDKNLFQTLIGVKYETKPEQLRQICSDIQKLFAEDPRVEWPGGRARFVNFADSALQIEIWVYILKADWGEFIAVKEELLLKIMEIVQNAGSGFAFPSRAVYVQHVDGSAEAALPAKSDAP